MRKKVNIPFLYKFFFRSQAQIVCHVSAAWLEQNEGISKNKYSTKTDATKCVAQYDEQINVAMGIVLFFHLFIMHFLCWTKYNLQHLDDNSLCDYRSGDHTCRRKLYEII